MGPLRVLSLATLVFGLIALQTVEGQTTPAGIDALAGFGWGCFPKCDDWHICDFKEKECVPINVCDPICDDNFECCGHNHCYCPWPKVVNVAGECEECDCPWGEICTHPHGQCMCPEDQVRHGDHCVDCDPTIECPVCPLDRICTIAGPGQASCECLPGSVETGSGECAWCHPCPDDCAGNHVCITPGHSDPYCACPPGTNENSAGDCVPCPVCPACTHGQVCVINGAVATCECPHSTYDSGFACLPLYACPQCGPHEVCVLPEHDLPYCACAEGFVRKDGKCIPCGKYDHDHGHGHGTVHAGYLGGLCDKGKCYGDFVRCGSSGRCECAANCDENPWPTCSPKRKTKQRW